ncbi:hypothetical protein [Butyrivibrio sp. WCD3002]|uniref:hypothetical protein n=1 Tax=Butyrivibrio sp. WCD3002 TaxID=1280676 RepID=UPI001FA7F721|nr:hypothetical protein [Butyrivibrio sp. WCD3002]
MASVSSAGELAIYASYLQFMPFITYVRALGYFFVNFFMIMLAIYLLRLIKGLTIKKGTTLIPLGIFSYIVLDFQYTYVEALGLDAENVFMDLVYILCMILMSLGAYFQEKYQYEFGLRSYERNKKSKKRLMLGVICISATDLALFLIHFLSENEFFYILIAVMGYWIMTATFENTQLDESLLESEKNLNKRLEEQVAQKTQDLKVANDNLKRLSSTDILTGLYNRRYSTSFIKNLTADYEKSRLFYALRWSLIPTASICQEVSEYRCIPRIRQIPIFFFNTLMQPCIW